MNVDRVLGAKVFETFDGYEMFERHAHRRLYIYSGEMGSFNFAHGNVGTKGNAIAVGGNQEKFRPPSGHETIRNKSAIERHDNMASGEAK